MIYVEVEAERKNLSKKNETGNRTRNVAKEVKMIMVRELKPNDNA